MSFMQNKVPVYQMKEVLKDIVATGAVPYISGSPGIGKSKLIQQLGEEMEYKVIDFRASTAQPFDMSGVPNFTKNEYGDTKTSFIPLDVWPLAKDYEHREMPINPTTNKPYKGFLIFLDELSSASKNMQAAMYKLVLDKKMNEDPLHPNTIIIAAGNREQDGAVVVPMSSALKNRLVMLEMSCEGSKDNIDYFLKVVMSKWHPLVRNMMVYQSGMLNDFKPDSGNSNYPTPRSWEKVSNYLSYCDENKGAKYKYNPLIIAGTIGETACAELYTLIELLTDGSLPTMEQIRDHPESITIQDKKKFKFAMCIRMEEYLRNNIRTVFSTKKEDPKVKDIVQTVKGVCKVLEKIGVDISYSCIGALSDYSILEEDFVKEQLVTLGKYYGK